MITFHYFASRGAAHYTHVTYYQYRNSRTSGRTVRDQNDHDVFSGQAPPSIVHLPLRLNTT